VFFFINNSTAAVDEYPVHAPVWPWSRTGVQYYVRSKLDGRGAFLFFIDTL